MEALLISTAIVCSILIVAGYIYDYVTARKAKKAAEQKKFLEEREKRYKENVARGMPTVGPLPMYARVGFSQGAAATPKKTEENEPYISAPSSAISYPSDPLDIIAPMSVILNSDDDTTRYSHSDHSWSYGGGDFGGSGAGGSYDSDSSSSSYDSSFSDSSSYDSGSSSSSDCD